MDFVVGLPITPQRHGCIMIVVDKLTKSSHFIPVKRTFNVLAIAQVFIKEIVRLHGFPKKSFPTRTFNSLLDSSKSFMKPWVRN